MAENPRMPLTGRGIAYLFLIVAAALTVSFLVIRGLGITNTNLQYNVTIALIVLLIGIFFCRDNVFIGLAPRALWSTIIAATLFGILYLIDTAI